MAQEKGNVFEEIGGLCGSVALLAINAAFVGWTVSILWKWFIASTFHLPSITIPQAVGLTIICRLLGGKESLSDEELKLGERLKKNAKSSFGNIEFSLAALCIGRIVLAFM